MYSTSKVSGVVKLELRGKGGVVGRRKTHSPFMWTLDKQNASFWAGTWFLRHWSASHDSSVESNQSKLINWNQLFEPSRTKSVSWTVSRGGSPGLSFPRSICRSLWINAAATQHAGSQDHSATSRSSQSMRLHLGCRETVIRRVNKPLIFRLFLTSGNIQKLLKHETPPWLPKIKTTSWSCQGWGTVFGWNRPGRQSAYRILIQY